MTSSDFATTKFMNVTVAEVSIHEFTTMMDKRYTLLLLLVLGSKKYVEWKKGKACSEI